MYWIRASMGVLITVFDWRRQWLTVVCSISSIIWAEDTNWHPGPGQELNIVSVSVSVYRGNGPLISQLS